MENNNDPSTGSGTNKNQNVKELTDEQLKQVAGGEMNLCTAIFGCKTMSLTTCDCQECNVGFVLKPNSRGVQECVLDITGLQDRRIIVR